MNSLLAKVKTEVYDRCLLHMSDFEIEPEGKEYYACQFKLNALTVACRNAKMTPKKVGQFVTFWKRNGDGPIEPFSDTDQIDVFAVNVRTKSLAGQYVFPKSVLIKKGIISTGTKEGKRAFRVYPPWDMTKSRQAEQTQKWQRDYFYEISPSTDFRRVVELYEAT